MNLDARYEKADPNKVITKQFQHLNTNERDQLLSLLRNYEYPFYSILGIWSTILVYLELRDNAKPVCSRPYPVPRVQKTMFRKEVEILVNLVVLEEANYSKWGASSFAKTKAKTNRIIFLIYFRNLTGQLKR